MLKSKYFKDASDEENVLLMNGVLKKKFALGWRFFISILIKCRDGEKGDEKDNIEQRRTKIRIRIRIRMYIFLLQLSIQ